MVIAEPGRYFARSAYTLVSQVIGRRCQMGSPAGQGVPDMLYQNDGVYGNFMNVIMEKERMAPQLYGASRKPQVSATKQGLDEEVSRGKYRYSVWGPTCDSIDCVARQATFDAEVQAGDWLVYHDMGGKLRKWVRGIMAWASVS